MMENAFDPFPRVAKVIEVSTLFKSGSPISLLRLKANSKL
jgi:hypothetical protein